MSLTLRNHCWRAVLEKVLSDVARRAPRGWSERALGEPRDSLRKCLALLASGGGRGRLAGVQREKVHRHHTFASYATAVIRRASAGGEAECGGGGRARDWVDDAVDELAAVDLDREYAALLDTWHRPVLFYVMPPTPRSPPHAAVLARALRCRRRTQRA